MTTHPAATEPATTPRRSGGGVFASFAPWIAFWILVGNVDFRTALLVACVIAIVHALREARSGGVKVLDVGTAAAFAALLALTFASDEAFLERWMQPLGNGALLVIALASVAIGRPFVLAYAKEEAPPEVWREPLFLRTVSAITWAWIGAFAVMTVSSAVPPLVDGAATLRDEDARLSIVFYWVIPTLALAAAIVFTRRYPDRVRRAASLAS